MSQARKCDLCFGYYINSGTVIIGQNVNDSIDVCPKCRKTLGLETTGAATKIYRRALINLLQRLLKS